MPDISIANTAPWHNECTDTYFFGNSIVGASGKPDGEWTFSIGPDYTSPNYISSEKLYILRGETRMDVCLNMRRLRGAGIFRGEWEADGIRMTVYDFAPPEMPVTLRRIHIDGADSNVTVCAQIVPFECETESDNAGVSIIKDTSRYCFGNRETLNWAERRCRIFFANGNAQQDGELFILCAKPDENGICTLVHHHSYGEEAVPVIDSEKSFNDTLAYWTEWFKAGHMPKAANQRDADALESLLLCVKMQQNRDGGSIAGIRKYANSYIHDTHGGMRLLLATGHHAEVRTLLSNIHSRWERAGFVPNWWSMGSDTFIGHSFNNDASEVTAYYIFMARDYLKATKDEEFIASIMPSLSWAAHAQLDWLRTHDYTIDFNGDETEQYCCNKDGEEYGRFDCHAGYEWKHEYLSFPSMSAAIASLEWYAKKTGEDISADIAALRAKIDEVFWDSNRNIHIWAAEKGENGFVHHNGRLTNYMLLPVWVGASLTEEREKTDALAAKEFRREDGFLPNCPEVMPGFCGHTMGLFLYSMLALGDKETADTAARTILDSPLLSMYGTVSEFYGPSCTSNGHNCRAFEGGILGEALVKYFESR